MADDIDKSEIGKVKPKLVIATDSYLPRWDGIASFLVQMIPLLKRRFDVTVIAPNFHGRRRRIEGVREILLPTSNLRVGDFDIPRVKRSRIRSVLTGADLVWTHSVGPIGRTAISLSHSMKKKVVSYVHSIEWELFSRALGRPLLYNPVSALSRRIVKSTYSKCDVLMMPSHESMNLFKWYKISTKMFVLPLGVDASRFVPPESKIEAKKAIGISPSSKVVGYCGRLAHEKDLQTLVRAFQRQRNVHEDLQLLIVGGGLEELHNRFSKIKGVILTGPKDNVVQYYQAMDIYAIPSLTETTSLSTLEAMSCEVPVISTPVGEMKNYIKSNKNGFLFTKGDSFELSKHIQTLLEDDKCRNKLGKNARLTVLEKYSWESSAMKIVDALVGLVEPKKS
ncbi:MAG: glycosyltransferase family 4 protein [Candidatus Woesearchaeota archaeon]